MPNYNILGWVGIILTFCIIILLIKKIRNPEMAGTKIKKTSFALLIIGVALMLISFSLAIIKQHIMAISIVTVWIGAIAISYALEKLQN